MLVVGVQRTHSSHLYFRLFRVCRRREHHLLVSIQIFTNLSLDFDDGLGSEFGLLELFLQLLHLFLHKIDLLDVTQGLSSALTQ